jgi:hypothetical protein
LAHTLEADFEWKHTAIQLELDKIIETRHNSLYDLIQVSHQQAEAAIDELVKLHSPLWGITHIT